MTRAYRAVLAGLLLAVVCWTFPSQVAASEDKQLNINSAAIADLTALKGIGEAKAKAIVTHREKHGPFRTVDGFKDVPGISDKLMETLRPQITVGTAAAPPVAAAAAAKP